MPLTDIQIRNLKPTTKPYRKFDGGGLYIEISPTGGKLFRYKYRFNGKHKTFSIGKYPDLTLSKAREQHRMAREMLASGEDPSAKKREKKLRAEKTFGVVAEEWFQKQQPGWTTLYSDTVWRRLEMNCLPWLKDKPIEEITTSDLLKSLRKVESRNAIDTARRTSQYLNNIFIYGVTCEYCESNPAGGLVKALTVPVKKHMAAIVDPKKIGELLRVIDGFEGTFIVKQALSLLPLVFTRPGELRASEWSEFDLDEKLWTLPAARMKMKRDHLVPLSRQAMEIIQSIKPLTGSGRFVFPSIRSNARPLSENTLNAALRRLGYTKDEQTAHGFRTLASTRLHEMGWKTEYIETQLAHADRNTVRGIYNKALYLEQRIEMMQKWADYLDRLKRGTKVIPLKR